MQLTQIQKEGYEELEKTNTQNKEYKTKKSGKPNKFHFIHSYYTRHNDVKRICFHAFVVFTMSYILMLNSYHYFIFYA